MESLILFAVGISAIAYSHLMMLRKRYLVIGALISAAGLLYVGIHWYVGTLKGAGGLALAIYALIAVLPFGFGLMVGVITGWVHSRILRSRDAG